MGENVNVFLARSEGAVWLLGCDRPFTAGAVGGGLRLGMREQKGARSGSCRNVDLDWDHMGLRYQWKLSIRYD